MSSRLIEKKLAINLMHSIKMLMELRRHAMMAHYIPIAIHEYTGMRLPARYTMHAQKLSKVYYACV